MHESKISDDILDLLTSAQYRLHKISLICTPERLKERLRLDIAGGVRSDDIVERSISRLDNYKSMDTHKVDVSNISAEQAANIIFGLVSQQSF